MTAARPIKSGSGGREGGRKEGTDIAAEAAGRMDLRPPMTASGRAAVVATLVTGANGGGGRQRVQHRRVSIAEYGEYAEYTAPHSQPPQLPRQHPQQIEVGGCGRGFWVLRSSWSLR